MNYPQAYWSSVIIANIWWAGNNEAKLLYTIFWFLIAVIFLVVELLVGDPCKTKENMEG